MNNSVYIYNITKKKLIKINLFYISEWISVWFEYIWISMKQFHYKFKCYYLVLLSIIDLLLIT